MPSQDERPKNKVTVSIYTGPLSLISRRKFKSFFNFSENCVGFFFYYFLGLFFSWAVGKALSTEMFLIIVSRLR